VALERPDDFAALRREAYKPTLAGSGPVTHAKNGAPRLQRKDYNPSSRAAVLVRGYMTNGYQV
jgi:hypothetical protein